MSDTRYLRAKETDIKETIVMETNKNSRQQLIRICVAAMFAALICVATMLIQIPMPGAGYVNFGDCFILVAAWVLGPVYGFAAGGIGSALADLFSGYPIYAPGTFVIKGLIAVAAALVAHVIIKKTGKRIVSFIVGSIAGELVMVWGYFLYEALVLGLGFGGALAVLMGNFIQGAFGAVVGVIITGIIAKTKVLSKFDAYAV